VNRPIARGWATVDIDRAVGELASLLRPGAAFEPVSRSMLLGARCVRGPTADTVAGRWIVVLEPDTEGRVAGFLARHGEGWAATWLVEDDAAGDPTDQPAPSARGPGPLGQEVFESGGPRWGPYRLKVTAATIEP
jgi:hypothetical protein